MTSCLGFVFLGWSLFEIWAKNEYFLVKFLNSVKAIEQERFAANEDIENGQLI